MKRCARLLLQSEGVCQGHAMPSCWVASGLGLTGEGLLAACLAEVAEAMFSSRRNELVQLSLCRFRLSAMPPTGPWTSRGHGKDAPDHV